jgi:hypothetical protein
VETPADVEEAVVVSNVQSMATQVGRLPPAVADLAIGAVPTVDLVDVRTVEADGLLAKPFALYIMEVKGLAHPGSVERVERRYSEFEALHRQITAAGEVEGLSLPSKWLAASSVSETVVAERRARLAEYVAVLTTLTNSRKMARTAGSSVAAIGELVLHFLGQQADHAGSIEAKPARVAQVQSIRELQIRASVAAADALASASLADEMRRTQAYARGLVPESSWAEIAAADSVGCESEAAETARQRR